MPFLSPVKFLVLNIRWHNDEKIASLRQPMLFISGDSDELVPPVQMKKLADLATKSSKVEFFSVAAGRHNDSWEVAGSKYYQVIDVFAFMSSLDIIIVVNLSD
jgi:hypothetical protein